MRLPISGLHVTFRLPDGHDDLAVLEAAGEPRQHRNQATPWTPLAASRNSTTPPKPSQRPNPSPWLLLTITDFEYGLLGLRRSLRRHGTLPLSLRLLRTHGNRVLHCHSAARNPTPHPTPSPALCLPKRLARPARKANHLPSTRRQGPTRRSGIRLALCVSRTTLHRAHCRIHPSKRAQHSNCRARHGGDGSHCLPPNRWSLRGLRNCGDPPTQRPFTRSRRTPCLRRWRAQRDSRYCRDLPLAGVRDTCAPATPPPGLHRSNSQRRNAMKRSPAATRSYLRQLAEPVPQPAAPAQAAPSHRARRLRPLRHSRYPSDPRIDI